MLQKITAVITVCLALSFASHAQTDSMANILNEQNDWPNLRRYMKDNERVRSMDNKNRVVFMGNSITEGWINANPGFFSQKGYINRGIGGQTTPQMLIRFRPDVVDLKPAVVVILAGINDIAGNTGPSSLEMIRDNIASMAEIASANGIKVILCSVLPASTLPWKPEIKPVPQVAAMNQWLQETAQQNGYIYVDYFTAMADADQGLPKSLSADGVHPNLDGYHIMEPLAEAAIQKALSRK